MMIWVGEHRNGLSCPVLLCNWMHTENSAPARTVVVVDLAQVGAARGTTEAAEGDDVLLLQDLVEVGASAGELHTLDGHGGLPHVLEGGAEVGGTGLSRLHGVLGLTRVLDHVICTKRRVSLIRTSVLSPMLSAKLQPASHPRETAKVHSHTATLAPRKRTAPSRISQRHHPSQPETQKTNKQNPVSPFLRDQQCTCIDWEDRLGPRATPCYPACRRPPNYLPNQQSHQSCTHNDLQAHTITDLALANTPRCRQQDDTGRHPPIPRKSPVPRNHMLRPHFSDHTSARAVPKQHNCCLLTTTCLWLCCLPEMVRWQDETPGRGIAKRSGCITWLLSARAVCTLTLF